MPLIARLLRRWRALGASSLVAAAMLGSGLTARSAGDLQGEIAAGKATAMTLRSEIAAAAARIRTTTNGLQQARAQLSSLQAELATRETQLRAVQNQLIAARDRLADLENRLRVAAGALAANLRTSYEDGQPDLMTVVLESRGFSDLLDRVDFLQRIGRQDAAVIGATRVARQAVARQATLLSGLEVRDRALAHDVLGRRNQVAALEAALLGRQISELGTRTRQTAELGRLNGKLQSLEAQAAAQARAAAATGNAAVGGIAVNTNGMVQAPPGAPAAVAEVIAAGNAIATLPYIYGGGHASFHADGYDCSGSVSYALAAAGLVSSPMVSGDFESWGDPGPGRWITVYANADHVWMEVAGWRFDTVALAETGTRWSRTGGEFAGFVVRHPPGL